ncbi:MAG: DUF2341 domain-containing protein [Patescibacteria group bacterium]
MTIKFSFEFLFKIGKFRFHKKKVFTFFTCILIFITLASLFYRFSSNSAQAAWFDDSYSYRQKTTVSNSGTVQTDFQVSITIDTATLITAGKMQSDCDDIRITDTNGKLLPHVIEEGSAPCNNASTKIWVKIPSILTTGQILYIYYGNPSATNAQDGKAVFAFYENFNAATLSGTFTATGGTSISGGALTITTGAVYTNATILPDSRSYMYEYRTQWSSTVVDYAGMMINNTQSGSGNNSDLDKLIYMMSNATTSIAQRGFAADGTAASYNIINNMTLYTPTATTYYIDGFSMDSSEIKFWNNGSQVGTTGTGSWSAQPYLWLGRYPGSTSGTTDITDITIDWVRARKYASTAPSASSTGSEEQGPGPIAYWRFDEGTGSSTYDATGQNQTGSITSATWQTEDMCINGKCLLFNGSTSYVQVTGTNPLKPTTNLTVSAWIRTSTTDSSGGEILSMGDNYGLRVNTSGTVSFFFRISGLWETLTTTSTVLDSKWHHVAGVLDDTNNLMRIYIDGKLAATQTETNIIVYDQGANFFLGKHGNAGTVYDFNGFIDEVKVYNFAKSASNIQTDFTSRGSSKSVSAQFGNPDIGKTLSSGLVGYWKLDESTNTTAADSSGNGNNLTDGGVGSTGQTTGKFSYGMEVESSDGLGSSRYKYITDNASLSITGDMTISAWVKPEDLTTDHIIAGKWDGAQYGYAIYQNNGFLTLDLRNDSDGNTASQKTNDSVLSANNWYHVAAVYSSSLRTVKLYVNGSESPSFTTNNIPSSLVDSTARFHIGVVNSTAGFYGPYDGIIDETRVYNRALSSVEMASLYAFAPGPAGWWKMDENTGTTANDSSGNGYSGTLTDGPVYTTGKYGSAIGFDGSNDDIKANDVLDNLAESLTVEVWVYRTSVSNDSELVSKKINPTSATDTGYTLYQWSSGNGGNTCLYISDGTDQWETCTATNSTISLNTWQHVAVVFDRDGGSSKSTIYLNGINSEDAEAGTIANIGSTANPNTFCIGAQSQNTGTACSNTHVHAGSLDDVRIYGYARTPKQIIEDMNAGHPAGGSPVGSYVSRWKFDDMTGTTAQDTTDNNNDLTLSGASWTPSGKFDGAWNGTGALWASRADDADFDFSATEDLTVSMWFKSDTADITSTEYLLNKSLSGGTTEPGYALYITASDTVCFGIDDDSTWNPDVESCSTTDVYDTNWHHVVGVRNVTTDKTYLYVDGYPHDNDTDTTTATLANGRILYVSDRQGADGGDEFNGDIDDVKVYRSALTADEVKIDYNAGSAAAFGDLDDHDEEGFSLPNPTGWWKMDDNTGTTTVDSSGNGLTGTITGSNFAWTTGKAGSGLEQFGTSSGNYISFTNTNLGTTNSVSFWVRFEPAASNGYVLIGSDTSGQYASYIDFAGNLWYYSPNSGNNVNVSISGEFTTGVWYHLAVSRSGTAVTFYKNGVQLGTTQTLTTNNALTVGALFNHKPSATSFTTDGAMDDVRIFTSALTATQVAYLYNRGAPTAHYKFDECQGTTAYNSALDSNGQAAGMNGTITLGASPSIGDCTTASTAWGNGATGKFNSSLDFDGSDDYVTLSSPTALDNITQLTISTWVNPAGFGGSGLGRIWDKGAALTNRSFYINSSNNSLWFNQSFGDGGQWHSGANTINTSQWQHVVITYDNSSFSNTPLFYINGVLKTTTANQTPTTGSSYDDSAQNAYIGNAVAGARSFDGLIDDFRIYKYLLTASQIKNLYNQGSAVRFGPQTGSP